MSEFIYLSYFLSDSLTAYGNGKRIVVEKSKSIIKGDSSNNSVLSFSSHIGTHIDYQFHFCKDGKKSSDYSIDDHIFNNIAVVETARISVSETSDMLDFVLCMDCIVL